MTKLPAFQFYPGDWRKDTELQSCSLAAQGLWINAICVAHECEPYGHLMLNGKPMTVAQIGKVVGGVSPKVVKPLLDELQANGVCSIDGGAYYSRRMTRDAALREERAETGRTNGKKGGDFGHLGGRPAINPKPPNKPPRGVFRNPPDPVSDNPHYPVSQNPRDPVFENRGDPVSEKPLKTPSSSSSSSSSSATETETYVSLSSAARAIPSAGEATKAMREAGIGEANPHNEDLRSMLAQGMTISELVSASVTALNSHADNPFKYALKVARSEREKAATRGALPPSTNAAQWAALSAEVASRPSVLDMTPEEREAHYGADAAQARG